jgi:hypothetical protein
VWNGVGFFSSVGIVARRGLSMQDTSVCLGKSLSAVRKGVPTVVHAMHRGGTRRSTVHRALVDHAANTQLRIRATVVKSNCMLEDSFSVSGVLPHPYALSTLMKLLFKPYVCRSCAVVNYNPEPPSQGAQLTGLWKKLHTNDSETLRCGDLPN